LNVEDAEFVGTKLQASERRVRVAKVDDDGRGVLLAAPGIVAALDHESFQLRKGDALEDTILGKVVADL
jgi:hypothetical protein